MSGLSPIPAQAAPSLLIVVPTLNSHRLLPRLLGSLQAQTWPHWRLLFVDGPSETEHRAALDQWCTEEPRCRWIRQDPGEPGIFGAMNQGFAAAQPSDWLLFWGSDDWAAGPHVLAAVMAELQRLCSEGIQPALLVCSGRYVDPDSRLPGRLSRFEPLAAGAGLLGAEAYRVALALGSTPPHQATLFGPAARAQLARYAPGFRLSADLDYFLQLGRASDLRVQILPLELVHMAAGGVSAQQTRRRLEEVRRAYQRAFGWFWLLPFLLRYARRLVSLLSFAPASHR